ncbi:C-type lectin domain family 4 member E [Larimichthys crocea]|uniref:C-type lectin domain family 4 member E n=1 Tax=Larimichthys crocea TaxID=215358 RepID=UPI000F5FFB3C|nr:C-type lectin domain family 4 member E [Larimichthys crocea]
MSVIVDKQEAKLSNITAENQQLIVARNILQTKTDELSMIVDEQKANLTNLTAENQQLIVARSILQTETDKLSVIVDEQKANLTNLTAENQQLIVARSILQTETDKLSVIVDEQKANLTNLTAENQQLIVARSILQTETDKLSRINDKFNWTLNTILNFDNFPVKKNCPEKKCRLCKENWILFQEKCYLIDLRDSPWLTWDESRKQCQNSNADLVVIDSLEEQKFISNHSQFYYDKFHGYWIGLYKDPNESSDDQKWLWINGRIDTLKYWLQEQDIGTPGPCVMVIPKKNPSASWDTADCIMQNRFICEMDPVIWPN